MNVGTHKNRKYISASDIGTTAFCDMSFYNKLQGIKSSKWNQSQLLRGNIAHDELSKQAVEEQQIDFWFIRLIKWLFGIFK